MSSLVTAVLAMIQALLPSITSSAAITTTVDALIELVPLAVKEVREVAPMFKNVISALSSQAEITPDQIAKLEEAESLIDAAFDTAADAAEKEDAAAGDA